MKMHAVGRNYIRSVSEDDPLRAGELLLECDDLELTVIDYPNGIARAMAAEEIAAKEAVDAALEAVRLQDRIERQELKAAAEAIRTDIQTILSNANAYMASPAANNAQAMAQILQLTKDIKALTKDFAFVSKVVKGLVP